jgi:enoyl-CoA hydratase/carnithine racemase
VQPSAAQGQTEACQMADEVLTERVGRHLLVVKLNRPQARNAVNAALAQALERAVLDAEADDEVRAVILTSTTDEVFCAGADLKDVAAGGHAGMYTEAGGFAGFVTAPRKKPWIAAVRGKALGGGLELCLACDMVVAGQDSSFGVPEVRRGVFAAAGGVIRLPRVIPRAVAYQMIVTGDPIPAARAYEVGLVNSIVPSSEVLSEATRLAAAIELGAPFAVRESLAIARLAHEEPEAKLWERCRDLGQRLLETQDFQEGPRAFAERRAPVWTGR